MNKIRYGKGENNYCVYTSLSEKLEEEADMKNNSIIRCNACGHEVNELGYCESCGYINKETKDE